MKIANLIPTDNEIEEEERDMAREREERGK